MEFLDSIDLAIVAVDRKTPFVAKVRNTLVNVFLGYIRLHREFINTNTNTFTIEKKDTGNPRDISHIHTLHGFQS